MYELTIEGSFASAHQLRGYKGKCENLHGHNWKVELSVEGKALNDIGLLIDFHELKRILGEVLVRLDHKNINEIPLLTGKIQAQKTLQDILPLKQKSCLMTTIRRLQSPM